MIAVRDAADADLAAILAIYNEAVANTTAIWNEQPGDLDSRRAVLADRRAKSFPFLVAERAGEVVGYASFGDFRPFDGYRHTVEHSVYVRHDRRGESIGRTLVLALIERAQALGKHVMVGGIEAGNVASIRLHESLGFVVVGRLPEVGFKFGRWLDLLFMQKML
jgi:phosphinothricin acetyltransferase